ncbi:hypothetical protein WJ96_07275 [Burkholderia ubonensis]|uniref:Uncharacterized protein n=1 Tax=Burkholderia ubonensis TaxID=101571 RepID=A0AAW3MRT9_9BURK|nr:hypothetical protein [Burkholderia ubonensis]KVP75500.1 hypothetical protein WJ93_09065 [Burkholderia ubonensis]KVP98314.1 hypothetical protein WJ96_07275 [Burkholderia ubonensis]KVZ93012.1 hypothetical protein WL25_18935 [Burkholderia ubonensis]
MSMISHAFAATLNPTYFDLSDVGAKKKLSWLGRSRGKARLGFGSSIWHEYETEFAAWQAAYDHFPDLLGMLQRSDRLSYRGYALRAEMMLKLGEAGFETMKETVHAEVFRIYESAMEALDAVKVSKAVPKVTRVAQSKSISWLEVRTRVRLPHEPEPVLLSVRCLPSAIEDKTWSVRLRYPATTDSSIREAQRRFDELVTQLGYQGITVKDVQHGTCIDI